MREEVIRIVEAYIDGIRKNNIDAVPIHSDVVFESPVRSIRGIANFRKGIEEFVPILKNIEVVHLTADDDTCAAVLNVDTAFGMVPFVEIPADCGREDCVCSGLLRSASDSGGDAADVGLGVHSDVEAE